MLAEMHAAAACTQCELGLSNARLAMLRMSTGGGVLTVHVLGVRAPTAVPT